MIEVIVAAAVVGTVVEIVRRRRARAELGRANVEPIEQVVEPERADHEEKQRVAQPGTVAQVLDHVPGPARRSEVVAQRDEARRATSRVVRWGVDGSTCWRITPPPRGWPEVISRLRDAARKGRRAVEVADHHGEVVTLLLTWEQGRLLASTGMVRVSFRRTYVEIAITSLAVETEGVEAWIRRELPRWVWWSRVELVDDTLEREQLEQSLVDSGVEMRRIETAADMAGWRIDASLGPAIVARPDVHACRRGEVWTGFDIGRRDSNEASLGIYDKRAKVAAERGPERAALLATMRELGLEDDEAWTRVETRLWGSALVLVDGETDEIIADARRPLAVLDEQLLGKLWAHYLTTYWIADASGGAARMRDNPELEAWTVARGAAGNVQGFKARRGSGAPTQVSAIREHARDRLGQVLVDVEVLAGTQLVEQVGPRARAEVERALADEKTIERFMRARAKYGELLASMKEHE